MTRLDPAKAEALLRKNGGKIPLNPKALLNLDPTGTLKGLLDKAQSKRKKDKSKAEEPQR